MYLVRKHSARVPMRPWPKNPAYTLKSLEKKIKMQELTPFLFSMEHDVCPLEGEGTLGH